MNDLDKLQRVLALCKHGVYLTVNEHRDVYESAAERLAEYDNAPDVAPDFLDDVARAKMVETNTIVELQFYPESAGSFHHAIHHDLGELLDWAYDQLVESGVKRRQTIEQHKAAKEGAR